GDRVLQSGDRGGRQSALRQQVERYRRGPRPDDPQATAAEECSCGAPREEAEMRAVENAPVRVVEATDEQLQPYDEIGDVRHADDDDRLPPAHLSPPASPPAPSLPP